MQREQPHTSELTSVRQVTRTLDRLNLLFQTHCTRRDGCLVASRTEDKTHLC